MCEKMYIYDILTQIYPKNSGFKWPAYLELILQASIFFSLFIDDDTLKHN